MARADVALGWVYMILYSLVGDVANVSDERSHLLFEARRNMTEMSIAVIEALYSAPFRPNIPAQLELELYIRNAPRLLMIGRFPRDPVERRVSDVIRGLSVIISVVNQRTTTSGVAQTTFTRDDRSASSSTGAALVL